MIRLKFIYYCQLTGFFSFPKVAQIPRIAVLIDRGMRWVGEQSANRVL